MNLPHFESNSEMPESLSGKLCSIDLQTLLEPCCANVCNSLCVANQTDSSTASAAAATAAAVADAAASAAAAAVAAAVAAAAALALRMSSIFGALRRHAARVPSMDFSKHLFASCCLRASHSSSHICVQEDSSGVSVRGRPPGLFGSRLWQALQRWYEQALQLNRVLPAFKAVLQPAQVFALWIQEPATTLDSSM